MLDLPSTPLQQLSKTFSGYEKGIEIKDLECIGSYNWVEATQPTIIVPGQSDSQTSCESFVDVHLRISQAVEKQSHSIFCSA